MKKLAPLLLLLLPFTVLSQKEANNWFFGIKAGIHFADDGSVSILTGSKMSTNEGCSSISDENGHLLFYTDGRSVWDRNHKLMPNGDYFGGTGLLGDPSSTQSAVIVPNNNNPNIYYIFTVDEPHHKNASAWPDQYTGTYTEINGQVDTIPEDDDGYNNGLNYSIVDLSVTGTNGSIGDITTRNVHLLTYDPTIDDEAKYKCSEKVTAVKNNTGTGYWVITQFIDKFYSFFVDVNGVNTTPVITQIEPLIPTSGYRRNAIGCIRVSPNGRKLAIAHGQNSTVTGSDDNNGMVYLYNFNNSNGIVSNPLLIKGDAPAYGVEFSAKSRKLYVSYDNSNSFGGLHQYDLLSSDIPASDILIATTQGAGTMQLGPNGKIYRTVNGGSVLNVINNPEEDGTACNFQANGVQLQQGTLSIFGLPPFITSFFIGNIKAINTCLGDITQFDFETDDPYDTIEWNFGDASPIVNGTSTPTHNYSATGVYNVAVTLAYQGNIQVISKKITIAEVPVANPIQSIALCDDNGDGQEIFNFTNSTAQIIDIQNPSSVQVDYFISQADADDNINPISKTAYTNTSDPQTIYARIQNIANTSCYDTTSFEISTLASPNITLSDEVVVCVNTKAPVRIDAGTNSTSLAYKWNTGQETSFIYVTQPGTYTVTVTNSNGCSKIRTITALPSDVALITDVIIEDLRDNNTVTIIATPTGNVNTTYTYSLDDPDGPFQESNYFENVTSGFHTVYVHDENGCGIVHKDISVLAIPRFFTPNGDSVNETWNIIGINALFYKNSKIYIFDRYGKLLANVNPQGLGWDGNYEGTKLPSTDYWYVVELDNGRTAKGHFSLIR
jgi:gliding motility-associated-like protein